MGRHSGYDGLPDVVAHDLVQQCVDPFGQGRHLLLLQGDAHQLCSRARLEEEGPLTGRTHRARNEAVRWIELMHDGGHDNSLKRTVKHCLRPGLREGGNLWHSLRESA